MDIVDRLNHPEMYLDAIDDAIREIETLRRRVAELESARKKTRKSTISDNIDELEAIVLGDEIDNPRFAWLKEKFNALRYAAPGSFSDMTRVVDTYRRAALE